MQRRHLRNDLWSNRARRFCSKLRNNYPNKHIKARQARFRHSWGKSQKRWIMDLEILQQIQPKKAQPPQIYSNSLRQIELYLLIESWKLRKYRVKMTLEQQPQHTTRSNRCSKREIINLWPSATTTITITSKELICHNRVVVTTMVVVVVIIRCSILGRPKLPPINSKEVA